ncbi:MAG: hypothetical protein K1X92_04090 [Bacteroidia bacterium]|nr:hypothetical protein [Bacteroidia bacterium]
MFYKKLLFFYFIVSGIPLFAQLGNRFASPDGVHIANTTTLIILDNTRNGVESAYNNAIRDAVEKYWKLNNYDFKRNSEVDDFIPAEGYSMLIKSFRQVTNADKFTTQIHSDISLLLCNKDSVSFYGGLDEIVSVNIADVDNPESILYQLPVLVKSIQHYINYISKNGPVDINDFQKKIKVYCTRNKNQVKKHTLYICQEELPGTLEAGKIKKAYGLPVIITDKKTIEKIIQADTPDAALMHFDPGYKRIWISGIKTGELLYSTIPLKRGLLTEKDFKAIYKAVK